MAAEETQIRAFLLGTAAEAQRLRDSVEMRLKGNVGKGEFFTAAMLEYALESQAAMAVAEWIRLGLGQNRPPLEVLLGCRESALEIVTDTGWPSSLLGMAIMQAQRDVCARFLKNTNRLL